MFELSEEHRMLKDLVAKFVDNELIPLERQVIAREASGGALGLTHDEEAPLHPIQLTQPLWHTVL